LQYINHDLNYYLKAFIRKLVCVCLFVLFTINSVQAAWYNNNWKHRVKVTIDSSRVPADLTDFPVYLDLSHLQGTGFFTNVNSDGRDIRITKADGVTEVPHEVVSINKNNSTGELYFLANGTLSSSADSDFYIYYKNPFAEAYAPNHSFGSQNVWSNNFVAVYHMNLDQSGKLKDSSANSHDGTLNASSPALALVDGSVGKAMSFNGSHISLGDMSASFTNQASIVAWLKRYSGAFSAFKTGLWSFETASTNSHYVWSDNFIYSATFRNGANGDRVVTPSNAAFDKTQWHQLYITTEPGASNYKILQNASVFHSGTGMNNIYVSSNSSLGHSNFDNNYKFYGLMDEIRISSVARSNHWITTEFNNLNSAETFYTVDVEEDAEPDTFSPQITSLSPINGAVEVVLHSDLIVRFDEAIVSGAGGIEIRKSSNGNLFEAFSNDKFQITANQLRVVPTKFFNSGHAYYVLVNNNAVLDLAGNNFAGISDNTTWSFTADTPGAWLNYAFEKRVKLRIPAGIVDEDLANFPVYVNLADFASTDFFSSVKDSGADLRVTAGDGQTELAFELVTLNKANKTGELHFKANSLLSASDNTFYIYYNNANASAYGASHPYGSESVWSDYSLVMHLGEKDFTVPDKTQFLDSTGFRNDSNSSQFLITNENYGVVGLGADFPARSIQIDHDVSLNKTDTLTVSAWVNPGVIGNHRGILQHGGAHNQYGNYSLNMQNTGHLNFTVNNNAASAASPSPLTAKSWHYVAATYDRNLANQNLKTFQNAVQTASANYNSVLTPDANPFFIGRYYSSAYPWSGYIDEVRVTSMVRSSSWLKAEYDNQISPSSFYSAMADEISPVDITVPKVVSTSPGNSVVGFSNFANNIYVNFDENIVPGNGIITIDYVNEVSWLSYTKTIDFTGLGEHDGGIASINQNVLTIDPIDNFNYGTYTITLSDGVVEDVSGNQNLEYSWSFTVADNPNPHGIPLHYRDFSGVDFPSFPKFKRRILIETPITPSNELNGYPLYIDMSLLNGTNFFEFANEDAIMVTTAEDPFASTVLPHEVVNFGPEGEIYVRMFANLNTGNIYLYYDLESGSIDNNPSDVWDSAFALVSHFENGAFDSTRFANHGNGYDHNNDPSIPTSSGKIGNALDVRLFETGTWGGTYNWNYVEYPAHRSYSSDDITISFWLNPIFFTSPPEPPWTGDAWGPFHKVLKVGNTGLGIRDKAFVGRDVQFIVGGSDDGDFEDGWSGTIKSDTTIPNSGSSWLHITIVSDDEDKEELFVNGQKDPQFSNNPKKQILNNFGQWVLQKQIEIGTKYDAMWGMFDNPHNFQIDELRISKFRRSDLWIETEFQNLSEPASFLTIAGDEEGDSWWMIHVSPYTGFHPYFPRMNWRKPRHHDISSLRYTNLSGIKNGPDENARIFVRRASLGQGHGDIIDTLTHANVSYLNDGFHAVIDLNSDLSFGCYDVIIQDNFFSTLDDEPLLSPTDELAWFFCITKPANSWLNVQWKSRVKLSTNTNLVVGDLVDFPLYLDLSLLNQSFFDNVDEFGSDIRITKSDGATELPFELAKIDVANGQGELYFNIKDEVLMENDSSIYYLYYNNPNAKPYTEAAEFGQYNVWGDEFVAVYHLTDVAKREIATVKDSTRNFLFQQGGFDPPYHIGEGIASNGVEIDRRVAIYPNNNHRGYNGINLKKIRERLEGKSEATVSTWVKLNDLTKASGLWYISGNFQNESEYFSLDNPAWMNTSAFKDSITYTTEEANIDKSEWQHVSVTSKPGVGNYRIYNDGQLLELDDGENELRFHSTDDGWGNFTPNDFWLGQSHAQPQMFDKALNGFADELRFSTVARSEGWIKTENNNMKHNSSFFTIEYENQSIDGEGFTVELVTTNPQNEQTDVSIMSNLVMNFNQYIVNNTGNLYILDYDTDLVVQTIPADDFIVDKYRVIVDPPFNLQPNTRYYINIDPAAITDNGNVNNFFAGISDKSTWNFTTGLNNHPGSGAAWYSCGWSERIAIDINHNMSGLTNFPVYVDLHSLASAGFFVGVHPEGNDIRVTKSDGVTEVPVEVVSTNKENQTGELHFLHEGDSNSYFIYYNNPTANPYPQGYAYGALNVWNDSYEGVWHMKPVDITTDQAFPLLAINDSSANTDGHLANATYPNSRLTSSQTINQALVPGVLGEGVQYGFNVSPNSLPTSYNTSTSLAGDYNVKDIWKLPSLEISYWMTSPYTSGYSLGLGLYGSWADLHYISQQEGKLSYSPVLKEGNNPQERDDGIVGTSNIIDANWHYLTVSFDDATKNCNLLVDGISEFSEKKLDKSLYYPAFNYSGGITLGGYGAVIGHFTWQHYGYYDELRVSSKPKSEAWHAAVYANQKTPKNFYSVGSSETLIDTLNEPQVVSLVPANGYDYFPINGQLIINFNEGVIGGAGQLQIMVDDPVNGDSLFESFSSGDVNFFGSSVEIIPSNPFDYGISYYVLIDSGFISDYCGNSFDGFSNKNDWTFMTQDPAAPVELMYYKPLTSRKNVVTNPYLEFRCNHPVTINAGNITIKRADNETIVDTIDISSDRVYGAGTETVKISPVNGLELNTDYTIEVDEGVFVDGFMNLSPAVSPENWYFRTKPVQDTPRFSEF
jgi:hypothetical protein